MILILISHGNYVVSYLTSNGLPNHVTIHHNPYKFSALRVAVLRIFGSNEVATVLRAYQGILTVFKCELIRLSRYFLAIFNTLFVFTIAAL